MGVVHGNLTPASSRRLFWLILTFSQESVAVTQGRGILINQGRSADRGLSRMRDDGVYGARWAATEFFRLDNGNQLPTKMSDVYSFACLMLQVRFSIHLPRHMVLTRCSRC